MPMTRGDHIFVGALVAAALLAWPLVASAGSAGDTALVTGPTGASRVSLGADSALVVQGRIGEVDVLVEGGAVSVVEAPCSDQVCVHTGAISASGAVVACVPNGVVIRIEGDGLEYDARIR